MVRFLPALLLLLLPLMGVAQEKSPTHRIHVITIGKGEELFARFGHIALAVQDLEHGRNTVYNFGTFDFSDPDLRFRYARGFLNYWLSYTSLDSFMGYYGGLNRDVHVQTLNLTDAQAKEVARRLAVNALPANRYYLYRHYLDNCCTRIRDLLDDVTDHAISRRFQPRKVDRDFRYWTKESLRGLPVYQSVILYSLGPAIDKPLSRWDEEFLPEVLMADLDEVRIGSDNRPLVLAKQHLVQRKGPPIGAEIPAVDIAVIAGLLILFVLGFVLPAAMGRRPIARRLLGLGLTVHGLLFGLGGLMLVLYWTVTTHFDTHYNENLLVNPFTHLWLIYPGVRLLAGRQPGPKLAVFLRWYLVGAIGLIGLDLALKLGPFIQGNLGVIALTLVCNGLLLIALRRSSTT